MTIGGATYDIFLHENICPLRYYCDQSGDFLLIPQGRKVEFSRVHYATGGGATNTAVAFARQGLRVTTFFIIGDDSQGNFILNELSREQIDRGSVVQLPGQITGTSVIVPASSGEGSLLVCHGVGNTMQAIQIPLSVIAQQEYLYIAPLPVAELLPVIVEYARAQSIKYIAINPGTNQLYVHPEYLYESLRFVDCLILNTAEAIQLFHWLVGEKKINIPMATLKKNDGSSVPPLLLFFSSYQGVTYTLDQYTSAILALGPKTVVITDGAAGAYVGTRSQIFFHPSFKVEISNTVGAGDAFGATFVASVARGFSIEQALFRGICNSSSVLQGADAKSGLLSAEQLDKAVQQQQINLVQCFNY